MFGLGQLGAGFGRMGVVRGSVGESVPPSGDDGVLDFSAAANSGLLALLEDI